MSKRVNKTIQTISSFSPKEKAILLKFLNSYNSVSIEKSLTKRVSNGVKCPHCNSSHVSRNGKPHNHQRFICVDCNKSFMESTNSIFSSMKIDDLTVKSIYNCMTNSNSVRQTARIAQVNKSTAFLWRHKILEAISTKSERLSGIIEADETFFRVSYKGNHTKDGFTMPRESKQRGTPAKFRGISSEQVCVPCGLDRNNHAISKIACTGKVSTATLELLYKGHIKSESILVADKMRSYVNFAKNKNLKLIQIDAGKGKQKVKGIYHIQHVNSYHSRLKKFMKKF